MITCRCRIWSNPCWRYCVCHAYKTQHARCIIDNVTD